MTDIRRQVSLFVPSPEATVFERLRGEIDPIQFGLIPAHVTACREDEVWDWTLVAERLAQLPKISIRIRFGLPIRHGDGCLLPATGPSREFDQFRRDLLTGFAATPRQHHAHITLLHPRNATPQNQVFEQVCRLSLPKEIVFTRVSLIEQINGGPWREFATFPS